MSGLGLRREISTVLEALMEIKRKIDIALPKGGGGGPDPNHLPTAKLGAYHEGRLSAADMDRIQLHLLFCPQCVRRLLRLVAYLEPASAPPALSGSEEPEVVMSASGTTPGAEAAAHGPKRHPPGS